MKKIPLIKPFINQAVRDKVLEVLDSGFLTEGTVTRELEELFSKYTDTLHAIAFTSCTTGMETALRALGIGPGDEVIVPDYTYPATASVVNIVGAKIVIVDIDPQTMLLDYAALENAITPATKAILPVSIFGNPLDYDQLNRIKNKYGLNIIEDAACSIGASFRGKRAGNLADISVFSMHPRKFITTGEGGMLTTNNPGWAEWINSYKHFGMNGKDSLPFQEIGTNYKLSDILSAIGLEQMRIVDTLFSRRKKLASYYLELIETVSNIEVPATTINGDHAYQSFCVFVENRDEIMQDMRSKGIEVQIGTYALHLEPAYQNMKKVGNLENSTKLFNNALTLPLHKNLSQEDQEKICKIINNVLNN